MLILAGFFLPWVNWAGSPMPGYAFPAGHFFEVSAKRFNLDNPFPGMAILFHFFWIIPAGALGVILLPLMGMRVHWVAALTSIATLTLVSIYVLFGKTLVMLGAIPSVVGSLSLSLYIISAAAIGLVLIAPSWKPGVKLLLILMGPATAWIGFTIMEKKVARQEYGDSADAESAYTVWAPDLLRDFEENDSLANAKYREQIITVTGRISETESPNDSTFNVKFMDSTGSYAIFPFTGHYLAKARHLQAGDSVVIRASCSGGVYSEILESSIISFKRSALIQ